MTFRNYIPKSALQLAGINDKLLDGGIDRINNEFFKVKSEVDILLQHVDSLARLAWIMKYTSEAMKQYVFHTNSMINELNQTFKTDIMKLLSQKDHIEDTNK